MKLYRFNFHRVENLSVELWEVVSFLSLHVPARNCRKRFDFCILCLLYCVYCSNFSSMDANNKTRGWRIEKEYDKRLVDNGMLEKIFTLTISIQLIENLEVCYGPLKLQNWNINFASILLEAFFSPFLVKIVKYHNWICSKLLASVAVFVL